MAPQGRPLRVAILGARGIGKVHARIFHDLGASICAVLGSTDESANLAVQDLARSFGIEAEPFSSLRQLLQMPLDVVSICTPARMHFDQTLAAFDAGLAVFCEKPLFWEDGLSLEKTIKQLDVLAKHRHRKLFMNTSNTVFMDAIKNKLGDPEQITSFFFKFFTQGRHRGNNIAVDLFPHGISLLLRLLGCRDLTAYASEVSDDSYQASFMYGPTCRSRFDFHEDPQGEKALAFSVNGHAFHRVQEGFGANYQAYIADVQTGERFRVEDPFRVAIADFCDYCRTPHQRKVDGFADVSANMQMMAQCLSGSTNSQHDHHGSQPKHV